MTSHSKRLFLPCAQSNSHVPSSCPPNGDSGIQAPCTYQLHQPLTVSESSTGYSATGWQQGKRMSRTHEMFGEPDLEVAYNTFTHIPWTRVQSPSPNLTAKETRKYNLPVCPIKINWIWQIHSWSLPQSHNPLFPKLQSFSNHLPDLCCMCVSWIII